MAYIKFKNGYFIFGKSKREIHPWIILITFIVFYGIWALLFITFQGPIYNTFGKNIIAVVIDEDAYVKNSFITKENIYKYQFVVEDKTYKGDSQCNKFKIGDSLLIRYLNFYPNKNQPLWILENKECK